ncbi:vomeronasal type-1 receptor 4-like [Octodon degus]|uniref:Vomeronasal type-1 receptor n=1 Tax=Octodon degus TaxID=10160 RepID=A0A6P3VDP5_OCTDE|nr:vomeronasal type-1 receptor 4-like [Octodon degus]
MSRSDMAIGVMFLTQTTLGILGNLSFVCYYLLLHDKESALRSTDLILKHLSLANFFIILSHGVPHIMAAFGMKESFSDFGCKILLYIYRLGRGVSTALTCLLSVFQTITIGPVYFCWKDLKVRAPRYIESSIYLCWILYVIINFIFPMQAYGKQNNKNMTTNRYFGFCSIKVSSNLFSSIYLVLLILPEVLFSVLIICGSAAMMYFLYQHKKQVQYIHTTTSPRSSPESRATQSIFVLVCTFVIFNTLSSLLHIYVAFTYHPSVWLVSFGALLSLSFPTVSPFIFMRRFHCTGALCKNSPI